MRKNNSLCKNESHGINNLNELNINYEVYKYSDIPFITKKFENNQYELIDKENYVPNSKNLKYEYFDIKRSDLLKILASGKNPITGEVSSFIDSKTKLALLDIAKTIEKREKTDNGFKIKISDYET